MDVDKRTMLDLTRAINSLDKTIAKQTRAMERPPRVSMYFNNHAAILKELGYQTLGPECFIDPGGNVISYQGANFYKACDAWIADIPEGGSKHCVKRVDHPNNHEAYDGTTS